MRAGRTHTPQPNNNPTYAQHNNTNSLRSTQSYGFFFHLSIFFWGGHAHTHTHPLGWPKVSNIVGRVCVCVCIVGPKQVAAVADTCEGKLHRWINTHGYAVLTRVLCACARRITMGNVQRTGAQEAAQRAIWCSRASVVRRTASASASDGGVVVDGERFKNLI